MKKRYFEQTLIKVSRLSDIAKMRNGVATIVKDEAAVYADVVFENDEQFFRVAHRDEKSVREFSSVEVAMRALTRAGFAEILVKQLDLEEQPKFIHVDDEEVIQWESKLDQMGIDAPIEELIKHRENAPSEAPSLEFLNAYIEGYQRALQKH